MPSSLEENLNVTDVSFVTSLGAESIVVTGSVLSTNTVRFAAGDRLPAASVATAVRSCRPSARLTISAYQLVASPVPPSAIWPAWPSLIATVTNDSAVPWTVKKLRTWLLLAGAVTTGAGGTTVSTLNDRMALPIT